MDRKNTRSWRGDTLFTDVDEAKCWNDGRDWAIKVLRESKAFSDYELDIDLIQQNEPGVDMLCPYQVQIGAMAGDRPIYNLVDLSGEEDNEDEAAL